MNMAISKRRSSCFVIQFIMLLLSSYGCLAMRMRSRNNITTDQSALLALKAHITRDPLNILSNWSSSASVCSWIGVRCGAKHQRVIGLDLSDKELGGTIPPHLGNLSFLRHISFHNNSFHGTLPNKLPNLRRMRSLNFSNNYLSGVIPAWIGSFTQLQVLSLSTNNFTGSIPTSIYNLSTLVALDLSFNMLSGPIPETIGALASLKFLYLKHNSLSGSIPTTIFNISLLERVNMEINFLSGTFPKPTVNMTSLRTLAFTYNNLTGVLSPNLFSFFPNLERLFISWNMLHGPIPSSLMQCSRLQDLSLSVNNFDGKIPKEIGNLTMLRSLYIGFNNFSDVDILLPISNLLRLERLSIARSSLIGSIPSGLGNLTLLQYVDLSENKLRGNIPTETSNLINLEYLSLGVNYISGSIPSRIFNNSNLETLSLSINHLSGQLPISMGLLLPYLKGIYLAENELTGPLPIYISNASELEFIDFGTNAFSGAILDGLGNLRYLRYLNLGYNNLKSKSLSSFLSSLTSCKDLKILDLNGNQLECDLPSTIGNFSSLQQFIAISCEIRGTLPQQIGNLTNLMLLDLSNNLITSSIPATFGNLHNLQGLYISNNKLQDTLPSELCNVQRLTYLYLGSNYLSGSIPFCLGNMVALRELSLESNNFNSSIPFGLWKLSDILKLDLSSNLLSGSLLSAIENMKTLEHLNLSANILSGDVPPSIGSLKNLVNLSLAGNNFQGLIPESFGDMVSLEFLDLSINNLSGELPKSLEKLSHLRYLNVSFNDLKGEIPLGGPFTNFSFESFIGNEGLCGPTTLAKRRCENKLRHGNGLELKYVSLVVVGSIILMSALIIIFIKFRVKIPRPSTQQRNDLPSLAAMRFVSAHELIQATNGYDDANMLGTGNFGSVYKGVLFDGAEIAVKVFKQQQEAYKSFDVECEVLRSIRHRNLVKIITGCCNGDFRALILDYMPNGDLNKWLYSYNYFLDILQRLNIMIDVASALDYLHNGYHIPIVHCDLKPSNVLLDQEMVAHVSDFGIAKLLGEGKEVVQTMTLATIGYMAPEYGSEGIISIKCDVYSYGILLIETFTKKRPTDEMFAGELSMNTWIEEAFFSGQVRQVMDVNLLRTDQQDLAMKLECASSVLDLAMRCCAKLPEKRINMNDALNCIKKIKAKFLVACMI